MSNIRAYLFVVAGHLLYLAWSNTMIINKSLIYSYIFKTLPFSRIEKLNLIAVSELFLHI